MYKVLDDQGSVLHRSTTAAEAIRYYNNNDDICSKIDPQPSESEFLQYDSNYIAKVAEAEGVQVPVVAPAVPSAESFLAPLATEVPTAAEALKLIELKNQKKHGKALKRLIDELIEADGSIAVPPSTPKYVLDRLTQLGYTVRPGHSGHISVTVYAVTEISLSSQVAKVVADSDKLNVTIPVTNTSVSHLIKPVTKAT